MEHIPFKAFQNGGNCRLKIYKAPKGQSASTASIKLYGRGAWATPQPTLVDDIFSAQLVDGAVNAENYKLYIDGQLSQAVSPTISNNKVIFNFADLAVDDRKRIQLRVSDDNVQKRDSVLSTAFYWPAKNLKNNSWATIKKALVSGKQLWNIGDSKPITLKDNREFDIILLDTKSSRYTTTNTSASSNMAVFGFNASVAKKKMQEEATNAGGWKSSLVNSWLNNEFIQLLPDDLKQCLSSVKVKSGAGNHTTDFVSSDCKLFLPAGIEVYGVATTWLSGESELETNARFNFTTTAYLANAWLRSPHYVYLDLLDKSKTNFIVVNRTADSEKANTEHAIFPIFVFANSEWNGTDLTGTKWLFNNTLSSLPDFTVNFVSNNKSFQSMSYIIDSHTIIYAEYDSEQVYDFNTATWLNEAYKTISITDGAGATSKTLISWLQANATLISW